jgi:hypothetical protein
VYQDRSELPSGYHLLQRTTAPAFDAEQAAMEQCEDRFPDAFCKVEKKICADSGLN